MMCWRNVFQGNSWPELFEVRLWWCCFFLVVVLCACVFEWVCMFGFLAHVFPGTREKGAISGLRRIEDSVRNFSHRSLIDQAKAPDKVIKVVPFLVWKWLELEVLRLRTRFLGVPHDVHSASTWWATLLPSAKTTTATGQPLTCNKKAGNYKVSFVSPNPTWECIIYIVRL